MKVALYVKFKAKVTGYNVAEGKQILPSYD